MATELNYQYVDYHDVSVRMTHERVVKDGKRRIKWVYLASGNVKRGAQTIASFHEVKLIVRYTDDIKQNDKPKEWYLWRQLKQMNKNTHNASVYYSLSPVSPVSPLRRTPCMMLRANVQQLLRHEQCQHWKLLLASTLPWKRFHRCSNTGALRFSSHLKSQTWSLHLADTSWEIANVQQLLRHEKCQHWKLLLARLENSWFLRDRKV